jgi:hypothetical protein
VRLGRQGVRELLELRRPPVRGLWTLDLFGVLFSRHMRRFDARALRLERLGLLYVRPDGERPLLVERLSVRNCAFVFDRSAVHQRPVQVHERVVRRLLRRRDLPIRQRGKRVRRRRSDVPILSREPRLRERLLHQLRDDLRGLLHRHHLQRSFAIDLRSWRRSLHRLRSTGIGPLLVERSLSVR